MGKQFEKGTRAALRDVSGWDLDRLGEPATRTLVDAFNQVVFAEPAPAGTPPDPIYPELPDSRKRGLPTGSPDFIGVCGLPKAGKDVVADYLIAHYRDVRRLTISDYIISEVNDLFAALGYPHRITQANKSLPEHRRLLQEWGAGRPFLDPDHFPDHCRETIRGFRAGGVRLVLMTGVRSRGDVTLVRGEQGVLWRVVRPGNPYRADHPQERAIEDVEAREILNPVEGDLAPFERAIEKALAAS